MLACLGLCLECYRVMHKLSILVIGGVALVDYPALPSRILLGSADGVSVYIVFMGHQYTVPIRVTQQFLLFSMFSIQ